MLSKTRIQKELELVSDCQTFNGTFENARKKLLELSIQYAKKIQSFSENLVLEFGVASGNTITKIANIVGSDNKVYGFDSFEGLPSEWKVGNTWNMCYKKKGAFDQEGKLPKVPQNVELVKGWFNDTIPKFLKNHNGKIAFLHIDSDLYSSAKTILTLLKPRFIQGTVIQFDEYYNFEGMENDSEIRAFLEFITESGYNYNYIGKTSWRQVSLILQKD
jgi:hypothetical protein